MALTLGLCILGTTQAQAAKPKKIEKSDYTVMIMPDGTREVHDGEMTPEEVLERYEEWDKEHSQG